MEFWREEKDTCIASSVNCQAQMWEDMVEDDVDEWGAVALLLFDDDDDDDDNNKDEIEQIERVKLLCRHLFDIKL